MFVAMFYDDIRVDALVDLEAVKSSCDRLTSVVLARVWLFFFCPMISDPVVTSVKDFTCVP